MNAALYAQLLTDMKAITEWLGPTPIIWNGKEYSGMKTRTTTSNDATVNGMWANDSGFVVIPRDAFTGEAIPVQGDTIKVNGKDFTVSNVVCAEDHPVVKISYQSPEAVK